MITLPILFREFRTTARKGRTYAIRAAFGGLLTVAVGMFLLMRMAGGVQQAPGQALLSSFAWEICILVFALAPALTCGCIAEERRDGTLGLLFLTHLNSADIVLGKFISRGVDLLLLVLSALPLMFVPVLLGGVGWGQTISVILTVFSLLLLALSFGVFFSAVSPSTIVAAILAYVGLVTYNVAVMALPHLDDPFPRLKGLVSLVPGWLPLASPFYTLFRGGVGNSSFSLLCCAVVGLTLVTVSIVCLPRVVHSSSTAGLRWRAWVRRRVGSRLEANPLSRSSRVIRANPVAWLSFTRSRTRWLLQSVVALGAVIWIYLAIAHSTGNDAFQGMYIIGSVAVFILKILILLYAARSFIAEKENGALELLLTTPVTNQQVVHGKLVAVTGHYGVLFLLAFGAMFLGALGGMDGPVSEYFVFTAITAATSVVAVTLVGLLVSAWSRTTMQAITISIAGMLLLSWFLSMASTVATLIFGLGGWQRSGDYGVLIRFGVTMGRVILDVVVALVAYRLLVKNLRTYAAR